MTKIWRFYRVPSEPIGYKTWTNGFGISVAYMLKHLIAIECFQEEKYDNRYIS
jgi:hypothetical protein